MAMVQYGLWPNCTNKCDFCLLDDREYKTEAERLHILSIIKENTSTTSLIWYGLNGKTAIVFAPFRSNCAGRLT